MPLSVAQNLDEAQRMNQYNRTDNISSFIAASQHPSDKQQRRAKVKSVPPPMAVLKQQIRGDQTFFMPNQIGGKNRVASQQPLQQVAPQHAGISSVKNQKSSNEIQKLKNNAILQKQIKQQRLTPSGRSDANSDFLHRKHNSVVIHNEQDYQSSQSIQEGYPISNQVSSKANGL